MKDQGPSERAEVKPSSAKSWLVRTLGGGDWTAEERLVAKRLACWLRNRFSEALGTAPVDLLQKALSESDRLFLPTLVLK